MGKWADVDGAVLETALACTRGSYQRGVVLGLESLSGSTLRGKAKKYGVHYARSRTNLLSRLKRAGVAVSERKGTHGRRILVLGTVDSGGR